MNLIGVTSCFLIGFKAHSKGDNCFLSFFFSFLKYKLDQEPLAVIMESRILNKTCVSPLPLQGSVTILEEWVGRR